MLYWNLDYESLKKVNPSLIYCSLTGYGQEGPYHKLAGHDINYMALTGMLDLNRDANGKPILSACQIADVGGGAYMLAMTCLAALVQGKGQYIDIAMIDGLPPLYTIVLAQCWGNISPQDVKLLDGGFVNYNVYQCSCGRWIALGALEMRFWNTFCELAQRPDWKREALHELAIQHFPIHKVQVLFAGKTCDEWLLLDQENDCCLSPVLTLAETQEDSQLQERGYFEKQEGIRMPWIK